ncbi:MAG TPA: phosphotransferase, partial [Verrucomicrobiae bacterium]
KVRAKGTDTATHDLLFTLRAHGFDERSVDGVGVPRPLGVVPKFRMWLQQKTSGISSAELLPSGDGVALARRIAEAAHKIHVLNLAPRREHTMAGELRILHERLGLLAQQRREWKTRLERVLEGCERIAAGVPTTEPRPIHRDFYPAQVLVDGGRLWLLDFDLFCLGDPAVDVGNFVGHITEQSVRSTGNPRALAEVEAALAERFVELSGPASRAAVEVCTTLTLVRHVHISTLFPERQPFTERLLEYCEERLSGSQT